MVERHELLAFVFACCVVQGLFLAPVVANLKHVNRRAVRTLALLILCFVPMLGEEFVSSAGLSRRFPHTIGSSITMDFLIGPLLFFYARSLMDPDRPFARRDLLHLAPFVGAFSVMLPFMALSGAEKLTAVRNGLPVSFELVIGAKIVVAVAYLSIILIRLRQFERRPDNPRARDPHVVWLRRLIVALAGVAVASVVLPLLSNAGIQLPFDSDTVGTVFICLSIYVISAILLRHPLSSLAPQGKPLTNVIVPAPFRRKYETSPLDERQKQDLLDRLVQAVPAHESRHGRRGHEDVARDLVPAGLRLVQPSARATVIHGLSQASRRNEQVSSIFDDPRIGPTRLSTWRP
jgi:hypothetical protein